MNIALAERQEIRTVRRCGYVLNHLTRALIVAAAAALVVVPASTASAVSADRFNCSDFPYQEDAQEYFDGQIGDPSHLDDDDDGIACEARPHRPTSAPPVLATTAVYRFWSPGFRNAHFFTTNADEASTIRTTDRNWIDEGVAFSAWRADGESCPGASQVYRFYSPRFLTHFYTASATEKEAIRSGDSNWRYEGVAYCATTGPVTGSVPVYRFWSPGFSKHHFTVDRNESHQLRTTDPNWQYEKIAFYVLP